MDRLLLKILLVLIASAGYTQVNIRGVVINGSDETTLPGTNIFVPDLQRGTVSDENGNFVLENCPNGRFLVTVSYVGFSTEILHLHLSSDTTIQVRLHPSSIPSEEIVVTGGRPSAQHENAIKIETITADNLRGSGSPTLVGSMNKIPGVDLISRGEGVVTPVIRGLSTSNILFLNNGFRLENFQFSESHPYQVSANGLNRVEVIKGPASLLYGSDAIGGVVNMVPEEPPPPSTLEGVIDMAYFSNTAGWQGMAGLKGKQGSWYWGLNASLADHADYFQGNNEFVPNSRFSGNSVKTYAGRTGKRSMTRIGYEYQKMKLGMTVEESVALVEERGRNAEVWYQDLDHHMLMWKSKIFLDQWKWGFNASYQSSRRRLNGSELTPDFRLVDMNLQTVIYEMKSTYTSSERSEFTLALQGMGQVNRNKDAPEHVLPDYALNDISLFGMVQHDFNHRWHIQVGLRFDNRFINVPEQEKTSHDHGGGHPGDDDEEEILEALNRYYGNMSGSLGATYRLSPELLLRGNLASAYRTPNIAELTQDGVHGVRYEQGDRNLSSQRNFEMDLSLHYHSDFVMFNLSGFYNYIFDYIHLSPTSDTADDGDRIFRYVQADARLYGLEASSEFQPFPWFKLMAVYSLIRGNKLEGDPLPFVPQDKLNIELTAGKEASGEAPGILFKAGVIIAFDQNNPSLYETTTAGYTIFYASAEGQFQVGRQEFRLAIIANNIFNRTYYDHLSLLKELNYYDPGRNISISLRVPLKFSTGSSK